MMGDSGFFLDNVASAGIGAILCLLGVFNVIVVGVIVVRCVRRSEV